MHESTNIPDINHKCSAEQWNRTVLEPWGFVKLDQILRRYFGLSLHISKQENKDGGISNDKLESNGNHECFVQAFITLPPRDESERQEEEHYIERELDYGEEISGNLSLFRYINLDSLTLTDEQSKRFRKAMKKLALEPSLSEWQIYYVDRAFLRSVTNRMNRGTAIRERLAKEETGNWPRLINMVKTLCCVKVPELALADDMYD